MRSIWFNKQLRLYYCSSAFDRGRVWDVPVPFRAKKKLNLSYERAFGAYTASQEIDVVTQHNICAANQDTAEHSKTSVRSIRSENIKQ